MPAAAVVKITSRNSTEGPMGQFSSKHTMETTGVVIVHISKKKICLSSQASFGVWCLPIGSRIVGEAREDAAVRIAQDKTGFRCRLVPVLMPSLQMGPHQTDADVRDARGPTVFHNVVEPITTHVQVMDS